MASRSKESPPRPRRRGRRIRLVLFAAAVLVAAGFLFRNPILSALIRGQLINLTGGGVEVAGARFEGLNRIRIDRIDIEAAGWEGPAKDVIQVENLLAEFRLLEILGGSFGFDQIEVGRARIRVAERSDDPSEINIASLRPPDDGEKDDKDDDDEDRTSRNLEGIGSVYIELLEIETGIADGAEWQPDEISRFHARIDADESGDGTHGFALASIEEQTRIDIATGTLDARSGGFTLRTDDIDLRRGTNLALSATARAVVSAMEIGGTLRTATVEWMPGEEPIASLSIDDLAFTPSGIDALAEEWVRFEAGRIDDQSPPLPRIELANGNIELQGDLIMISGKGGRLARTVEADALPTMGITAMFKMRLTGIEEEFDTKNLASWGESLLDTAPFELDVELERFVRGPEGIGRPTDLPRPVAEALEVLTAQSWDLSATASVKRGSLDPEAADDTEIKASATLLLVDGRGMYENFRYPLHAVEAMLTVDGDIIDVRRLTALGPGGDRIHLEGVIDGTSDDAGVDLRLWSSEIALDDDLLAALPESTEKGLRTLFDRTAADRLAEAGLLPNRPAIEEAAARLPRLRQTLRDATASDDEDLGPRLDREITRIETMVQNGPFELGGRGAIDLRIHRPRVKGYPVAVEGPIRLRDVGGVFSQFPYPMMVRQGGILLEDLAVVIEEPGLEVNTIFGGQGRISGRVDLPRDGEGGRDVHPTLELRFKNDLLSACLLAAVPPALEGRPSAAAIPGWPGTVRSKAVEPVISMGLEGTLDYVVLVSTDADGDAGFAVTGNLFDGSATPVDQPADGGDDDEPTWPLGFDLEDVRATLEVDDDGLELIGFTGRRGDGDVRARGLYDFRTEIGRGIARLRGLDLEPLYLELLPDASIEEGLRLWDRWEPSGRFNADLHWSRRDSETEMELDAEPLWAEFNTTTGRTRLDRERGQIGLRDGWIEVHDLALRLSTDGRIDGGLRLDGDYGYRELPTPRRLQGVLDNARFESPALEEVLRLATGEVLADWWTGRSPAGRFKGSFGLTSGRGQESDFDLDLQPSTFTLLAVEGDPASRGGGRIEENGSIRIRDRQFSLGPLELLADNGSRLWFDVVVPNLLRPEIGARFRLRMPDNSVAESGFLPPPFSSLINAESVRAGAVDVEGEILAKYWIPTGMPDPEDPTIPYGYEASGTLDFDRLDWDLDGSPVTLETDSRGIRLGLTATAGIPEEFLLEAEFPLIEVAGRRVRGTRASGRLDDDPRASNPVFLIAGDRGTIGGGSAVFEVRVESEAERYSFDGILTDVDLDALSDNFVELEYAPGGDEDPTPAYLVGRLAMGGIFDVPESLVGHGRIEARDARFVGRSELTLLQLGQLLPPIQDELATASAEFWINGGLVLMDPIVLEAETITLEGRGELRLADWQWSLRLQPEGRVPGWSELVSAISGTFAAIDVGGTPAEPILEVVPLPLAVPLAELKDVPIESPAPSPSFQAPPGS